MRQILLNQIREQLLALLPAPDRLLMANGAMAVTRIDGDMPSTQCFYSPMVALVAQGEKRSVIGGHDANYGPGQSAVVGVDLPGAYHIGGPSPFLSFSLKLDKKEISALLLDDPSLKKEVKSGTPPVIVADTSLEILGCISRILGTLQNSKRFKVLWPLLSREFHYYLLAGSQGDCVRLFYSGESRSSQIAKAIQYLRENFQKPLSMDELAESVHMTGSTFNRHFREITNLSPLQFQKQLRLFEAERLLMNKGKDVGSAALAVGYESVSQFTRDYKKQFGESPAKDVKRKKEI